MTKDVAVYTNPLFEQWIIEGKMIAAELEAEGRLRYIEEPLEVAIDDAVCRWYHTARTQEELCSFLRRALAECCEVDLPVEDRYDEICCIDEEWC